ncbi:hypothetical protein [Ottowia testudinis]|uniref:Uncharacterized protein n=1 Tax=Ottowia testudinis TaxID=2816950 RepID=A0A975H4Y6_9BURK|nr:hypothetical protein [Ottowia testudinis]QTD44402.1 hypothetical protein J1M35_15035 [Ottowia testudinis]
MPMRWYWLKKLVLATGWGVTSLAMMAHGGAQVMPASACIPAVSYLPLDAGQVGRDDHGVAALGTYERISPDGRFILRSYSGARLGKVTLMELPAEPVGPVRLYRTPFSNEAFPVQGTWRYLVDITGEHYRFTDILKLQGRATPLFKGGMTGFYAAASEMSAAPAVNLHPVHGLSQRVHIRSLSWPQNADPDGQGVGPLQIATIEVADDGAAARIVKTTGPQFICGGRANVDGNVYALPMLSVDGAEFSAIPQVPRTGQPSMRVYGLAAAPQAVDHACELRADLGFSPGKAVFGFPRDAAAAWLTFSDLGHVYVHDRALKLTFRLDHAKHGVLASAFPGLTRDGRVIYGATWRDCADTQTCPEQAGYVVVDPYQSEAYRRHWRLAGAAPPVACITGDDVAAERARFARLHGLAN